MARRQSENATLRLETLESASTTQPRSLFQEHFGSDPGPRASRMFMQGNLSWLAQSQHEGYTFERDRQKLSQELNKVISAQSVRRAPHRPGTRLIREWRGKVYDVTVVEDGFDWNGRNYRSLSRIATEITGVRWSGPRFFGLKGVRR